jgi:biopolymer transport protein TolQ
VLSRIPAMDKLKKIINFSILIVFLAFWTLPPSSFAADDDKGRKKDKAEVADKSAPIEEISEVDVSDAGIFARAWQGGFVVFMVLLILIAFSVVTWAVVITKILHLRKIEAAGKVFIKSFWDSRSLNDLNGKLAEFQYSPVREVFRSGYAELVRGSQLREQSGANNPLVIRAAVENLTRSLQKSKISERRRMEKYLQILSISASTSPFIGLFGTVWGIMGAFEGIARSGSASLAAVAPGISEALIATAFGLAAAIPAVIGYNLSSARIRQLASQIDGFMSDFLNIVERYLVSDRSKSHAGPAAGPAAGRPHEVD